MNRGTVEVEVSEQGHGRGGSKGTGEGYMRNLREQGHGTGRRKGTGKQ